MDKSLEAAKVVSAWRERERNIVVSEGKCKVNVIKS